MKFPLNVARKWLDQLIHHCEPVLLLKADKPFTPYLLQTQQMNLIIIILLSRGNAISTAPINNGTKKFPKPPTIPGITIKKIIRNACAVIIVLYNWASFANICVPGDPNSILINKDKQVPIIPLNIAKYKYNVPISLALVLYNHLLHQSPRVISDT